MRHEPAPEPAGGFLWPGGPTELPCPVEVAGERFTVAWWPPLRVAYAITRGVWLVPHLLADEDRTRVNAMLRDNTHPLTEIELQKATVLLTAALGGIEQGVNGWRAAYRLCVTVLHAWPQAATAATRRGVDPSTSPLWRTLSVAYGEFVENPNAEDKQVKAAKTELYAPLQGEPAWMRGVKPKPAIDPAIAKRNALKLFERVTGRKAVLPPRPGQTQRVDAVRTGDRAAMEPGRGVRPTVGRVGKRVDPPAGHGPPVR